ncbi:hypothetical protein J1N35_037824 [Gossypium stocksii]|uniref:Putative plant transposon protein domain-containing protein n=1 Tax=Gossypium stocksii TaxID=47602 RepID=A0A9D3UL91_9ROSI|nr:hypothetical protein J1N35_037824 [Gossypium stocksii]
MPISHSSTISIERILLLYAIMIEKSINVRKIILKEIHDYARKKTESAYFPSLITLLCLRAQVKIKANLKGPYVQRSITAHDLERLVENVRELNPIEPSELTELEPDKLMNKFKTKANSVTKMEEVESEDEPNEPEQIKEPEDEPNVDEPVEPSIDPKLTIPMPTSSDTVK